MTLFKIKDIDLNHSLKGEEIYLPDVLTGEPVKYIRLTVDLPPESVQQDVDYDEGSPDWDNASQDLADADWESGAPTPYD